MTGMVSLNPYSNGLLSEMFVASATLITIRLNPYSNGLLSEANTQPMLSLVIAMS